MKADQRRDEGRGEATRRRLIEAAVQVFGKNGFDAVGTRELAEAAGANQAAILYHFGGKEGLLLAAAEEIATVGRAALSPLLEQVKAVPLESLSRSALADLVRGVFRSLTQGLVGHLGLGFRAQFLVREQLGPGPAFGVLYEGYIRAIHEAITGIVAASRGLSPRSPRAALEAHALIGSVLGFVVARTTLCRRLGWRGYSARRAGEIETAVVSLALRSLGLPEDPSEMNP